MTHQTGARAALSLTTQIRYGLLAFSVLALLITGALLIQISFSAQLERIAVAQHEQSRAAAISIDSYLDDIQRKLSLLARVRGLTDQPEPTQRSLLEALTRSNSAYELVALLDGRGAVVAEVAPSGGERPADYGAEPVFQRAFARREDYIGPVEINPQTGLPEVTLGVPVRDGRDQVAGVLVARVNLSFLAFVVAETRVGETGYAYVLDSGDQLIADREGAVGEQTVVNLAARSFALPRVDAGPVGEPYTGLYGQEVLGAVSPVSSTHWRVVVEQPTAEAYAPLWQMMSVMGGALLATVLLASIVGVIFSRRVVRPLQRLTAAAERMSAGDLSARVDIPDGDELGVLASTFNSMTDRLGRLFAEQAARAEAEAAQRRFAFLAQASATLAASLDYEVTLGNLAQLVVPAMADWCTIDALAEDGQLRRVGAAHREPGRAERLRALAERYPIDLDGPHPVARVLRSGEAAIITELDHDQLAGVAQDEKHLRELLDLAPHSTLVVPLRARSQVLGTISFVASEPGRYRQADLAMAEDLAQRAATAVDNALLYREAQQAIRARDEFLSVASHELKTPLTTVMGNAQLLQRRSARSGSLPEREQRSVSVIVDQVGRLNRLIEGLLDIGRIDRGQITVERGSVDLAAMVRRVVAEFQPSLERHTLRCTVEGEPLVVEGDELRLEQVLQNLLQNAIKYSPAGGPVEVHLRRQDGSAVLAVADQGIGIPQEALPQLFERFYRAGNTRRQQLAGLGIGLFVVREIVSLHGGSVDVASREGEGTVFSVTLPLSGGG